MIWWEWPLDAVGVLLLLVLLYALCLMVRRRLIGRHGGTFELSYRVRATKPGRGWLLGVGRYSGERLEWFRIFSVSPAPKRIWERTSLHYDSSRDPEGAELYELYPDHIVVTCRVGSAPLEPSWVELAMSPASLIGFQSWLESRNPGTDWSR